MSDVASIQFKRTANQFLHDYNAQQKLSSLGKLISYSILAVSFFIVISHILVALSDAEWPFFSLYNGASSSRFVWLSLLADLPAWYILQENKRRSRYTSKDDIYSFLDPYGQRFMADALAIAAEQRRQLDVGLMLLCMLTSNYMKKVLSRLEVDAASVIPHVEQHLTARLVATGTPGAQMEPTLQAYCIESAERALARGDSSWGLADLFLTFLQRESSIATLFERIDVTPDRFSTVLGWLSTKDHLWQSYDALQKTRLHTGPVNRAWTSVPTPTLDHYGHDLTIQAASGAVPLVSVREQYVEEAIRIISRATKNSLLLVGEPGVGKSTIVGRIALHMLSGQAPPSLQDKRLVQLDAASLHADQRGFAATFSQIVNEAERAGNVILFIPELQDLANEQTQGVAGVELLLPILERARMQIIGATTIREYHLAVERSTSFASSFGVIEVPELGQEQALTVLQETAFELEAKHHVSISLKAMQAAVSLSSQYIHDHVLPEKAIDLIDEAASFASSEKRNEVLESDVRTILSQHTNIPLTQVNQNEQELLLNLEQALHERVIGQDEAVRAVAESLRRARAGLKDSSRPIGVFLFVGPTGVGKTELAKALSSVYFQSEEAMVRLDMSEFQGAEAVQSLIGSERQEGLLTAPVRNHPFTLLLLDEFEKANSQVRNLFLQVFDDGRMTDGAGRVIDFKNSIIIATSNAGSLEIQQAVGAGQNYDQLRELVIGQILHQLYTPELLNRFDGIVVFKPLSKQEIVQIAGLEIKQVVDGLEKSSGVHLVVTQEVIEALATLGFDPTMGGRPLRRVIQDRLEGPLAKKILAGGLKRGDSISLAVSDLDPAS